MPDNRYKLIRRTPEEAYGTLSATPEFTYPESIVPETSIIDTLYEDAKRLPDDVREGLKQHLTAIGAPPWTGPAPRDTLLPGTAPDDMETLSQLLGSVHTGGPKFGLGLIRIPGKELTIGDTHFKNELNMMESGTTPYKKGIGGAGFSGHRLLYDEKPPITVPVPRTADIPLDVFSGLDPQRFQTHVEPGGQRFMSGALRGPKPPVKYTRGSNVHYPLPDETAKTHHPVAHATSEELDVIEETGEGSRFKQPVTPSALEVVSEVQPETNVSQQGLQIKPQAAAPPPTSTLGQQFNAAERQAMNAAAQFSPRLGADPEARFGDMQMVYQRMLQDDPRAIVLMDDIQNAIESGRYGNPSEQGTTAWRFHMYNQPDFNYRERPYMWNPLSLRNQLGELNVAGVPPGYHGPGQIRQILERWADHFQVPRRNPANVQAQPPVPKPKVEPPTVSPPKVESRTEYDQIRLGEAMYNAARQDVKRRGNIPLFGRSGWSYTRGGGGEPFTTPEGQVRPSPGTIDMYETIPRKMGMVPDVVRLESLPGTKFNNNLREWGQYMDPANVTDPNMRINPIGRHIMEQGGYIKGKEAHEGFGHTSDLPVWVHPEELEQLKRLGWWTPEKGRGEELLSQVADAERYKAWGKEHLPTEGNRLVDKLVEKLNSVPDKDFLLNVARLSNDPEFSELMSNTRGAIRFNMSPNERLQLREHMLRSGGIIEPREFSTKNDNLTSLLFAYGSMKYKPTLKDFIAAVKSPTSHPYFSNFSPDSILDAVVKDKPMLRPAKNIVERLLVPGGAPGFGSSAFRSRLAEQLAEGKHRDIVPQLTELLRTKGSRAFGWLESDQPFTVGGIKSPEFKLALNKEGAYHLDEVRRQRAHEKLSMVATNAIKKGVDDESWDYRYIRRAIRNGYLPEETVTKFGKQGQRLTNMIKKDNILRDKLRNINTTNGAAEFLRTLEKELK